MIGQTNALPESKAKLSVEANVTTGAVVSATKGGTTVTGASVGGTCVLSIPDPGTWTVSANLSGQNSTSENINITDDYAVHIVFASATLNNNTWSTIKAVSDANQGANYWAVGDRKSVTLNGTVGDLTLSNFSTYAFILGFNHNSTYEGNQKIHFQLAKTALTGGKDIAFIDSKYGTSFTGTAGYFTMYVNGYNNGGWQYSQIRTDYLGDAGSFINALPSDLSSVLKLVTKYTNNGGGSQNIRVNVTPTNDYMFLLAEYEVFGTRTYANSYEQDFQQQYAYYSAGNSKVKYRHSSTTNTCNWNLRSPGCGSVVDWVRVSTNGAAESSTASYCSSISPAFCV